MKSCIIDIETTDLDPKKGRILCIGIKPLGEAPIVFFSENEEQLIRDALTFCNSVSEIIGYNLNFDIQYIFAKCLKYDIPSQNFFRIHCIDLMQTMKSVKRFYSFNKPGKLSEWTEFIFNESKHPFHEKEGEKFTLENIAEIIDYNKRDLEITELLYKRIQNVLGLK